MERSELIGLVSALLAAATQRGDMSIIVVCEELGRRLVDEGEPKPNPVTEAVVAEAQCPACADRRVKRTALQRKWRHRKKENPIGKRHKPRGLTAGQ